MWKKILGKFALPILCFIILAILYIDYQFIFSKVASRSRFVKELIVISDANREPVFRVSKMIKYSSAEATDNTAEQNLQDLSISQYSDIALYIDNFKEEITEENTIKELYLDNFKIDVGYHYGAPTLYYKNPLEISKFRMVEENEIKDKLEYEIIYTNEENQNTDYHKPVFFTDCSNPITIGYINKEIINNYQVTKENGLVSFDGRIFNNLDINLKELSPKISFTIHLKNHLDERFICNVSANLKLETEKGSVKSGYIIEILEDMKYYNFFKEVKF